MDIRQIIERHVATAGQQPVSLLSRPDQVSAPGAGQPAAAAAEAAARIGDRLGEIAKRADARRNTTWAVGQAGALLREMASLQTRLQGEATGRAEGFTQDFDRRFGERVDEIVAEAPSADAAELFRQRVEANRTALWASNNTFQAGAAYSDDIATYSSGQEAIAGAVYDGTLTPDEAARSSAAAIAAASEWMRPQDLTEERAERPAALATAYAEGRIERGDAAAVARELGVTGNRGVAPPGTAAAAGAAVPNDLPEFMQVHADEMAARGLDPTATINISRSESGFRNIPTGITGEDGQPLSDAFGPWQILSTTWAGIMRDHPELGLTAAGRFDEHQQALAAAALADDAVRLIERAVDRPVTDRDLYLAWYVGAPRAAAMLAAGDDARAADHAPAHWFTTHGMPADATVGEVVRRLSASAGLSGRPVRLAGGAPLPVAGAVTAAGWTDALPWQERQRLARLAQAGIEDERAPQRVALTDRIGNEIAAYRAGDTVATPITEADLYRVYDDDRAAAEWRRLQDEQALGEAIRAASLPTASNAELELLTAAWAPDPDRPDYRDQQDRAAALDRAIADRRDDAAELVDALVDDEAAMAASGQPYTPLITEDQVRLAVGEDRFAEVWGRIEDLRADWRTGRAFQGQTPAEIEAQLAAFGVQPGADYAQQAARLAGLRDAAQRELTARAEDPAGLLMQRSAPVRQAWEQAETPEQYRDAARLTLEAEALLGIPAQDRRALPAAHAAAFAQAWGEATDPAEQLDMLYAVTVGLGDDQAGRAVLDQLIEAGLPADLDWVLEVARNPLHRPAAMRVLHAVTTAPPEIAESAVSSDLDSRVDAALAEGIGGAMQQAARLTLDRRGSEEHQRLVDLARRLARFHYVRDGSVRRAVERTMADLVGDRGAIVDEDLAFVTLPAGADADAVETGLAALRETMPAALEGAVAPVMEGAIDRELERRDLLDLAETGIWVNHGDGFALVDPDSGRTLERAEGGPWVVSLADVLRTAGAARVAQQQRLQQPGPLWSYDPTRGVFPDPLQGRTP